MRTRPSPAVTRLGRVLMLCGIVLAGCGADTGPEVIDLDGRTMGTYWSVRIVEPPGELDVQGLRDDLDSALVRVNARMSIYDPDSELSRFNRGPIGEWVPVSSELATVVAAALEVSALSDGAFDVTVGPLVDLWGFGATETGRDLVPDADAIAAALARVDWRAIDVRTDPPALRRHADVSIDLGGIAKGYGADVLAELLEAHGATRYLADIGGDMRARGRNPRGHPWRVGVEVPAVGARGGVHTVVGVESGAVTTSGDYRNFFVHEGVRYSHSIDPASGWPVVREVASVTVIHPSAMWSDGFSTALTVLGPDAGLELAGELSLAVLFILYTEDGLRERASPEFAEYRLAGDP